MAFIAVSPDDPKVRYAIREIDDPRDTRIAQLEAALNEIRDDLSAYVERLGSEERTLRMIDAVLPRPPEGDMRMSHEELDA
jgi:hypothetical protein